MCAGLHTGEKAEESVCLGEASKEDSGNSGDRYKGGTRGSGGRPGRTEPAPVLCVALFKKQGRNLTSRKQHSGGSAISKDELPLCRHADLPWGEAPVSDQHAVDLGVAPGAAGSV